MSRFVTFTVFEGSSEKSVAKADLPVHIDLDAIVAVRDYRTRNPNNPAVLIDTGGSSLWAVYGTPEDTLDRIKNHDTDD